MYADQECTTCDWSKLLKYVCTGWEWKPLAHFCNNTHTFVQQGGEDHTPWHKPADQECRTCEWSRLLKYICTGWEWKPLAHVCKNAHARAQQGGGDHTPWHKHVDQECRTCEWSKWLKYVCTGWEWKPLAHFCRNSHARSQQGGGEHTPCHRHRSKTAGGRIVVCPNDATQWTKHRPSQLSTQATKVATPSKTCRWFSRTYSPLQRCSGQGAARPLHMLPQFPKKWHHVGKTKIQKCSRQVVFAPAAMNASSTSGHRPWHTPKDHRTLNEREREREETQPTPTMNYHSRQ